jgi:hypothetical protein
MNKSYFPILRIFLLILFLGQLTLTQAQTLTAPSAEDVSANDTGHSINGTYSMSGYDTTKNYSVVISLEGNTGGATFSVVTTTGLSFPGMAFPTGLTDVTKAYFYGTPSDIEDALNSMTFTTTNVANGELKMHVYIYPYAANTIFNPGNGHVYNVVSNQSISWSNALSASSSTFFGGSTGYMATVTSQDEQDFFYRLDKSVWLGLSDAASEGTFKWVTGPDSGTVVRTPSGNVSGVFEKWASGQPNNYNNNEDYVGFYRPSGQYYGWRDYGQTTSEIHGYVTEYGTSTSGMATDIQSVQTSLVVLTQKRYLSDATIAEIPAYTLVSGGVEPSLEVDYFGTSLVIGTDYTATYSNNTSPGTATVTITGVGDYEGTISATYEVVELTAPNNQNVPLNTENWSLKQQYDLEGYDSTKNYKASIILIGDSAASFSINDTSGLSFDYGFNDWTEILWVNIIGKSYDIENALNSIKINTSQNPGDIKLRVFITSQIANTFLNPNNGHIYQYSSGQITWTNANLAANSMEYEDVSGYITTLTSEQEDNFVSNNVNATNFWIGLSDAANEGEWYWVTGPESGTKVWSASAGNTTGFTGIVNGQWCNWVTNDPNNATFNFGTGQDYAVAKFLGNTEWNDVNNGDTRNNGYIVEYGSWTDAMQMSFYSTQKSETVITQVQQGITITSPTTTVVGEDATSSLNFNVALTINPSGDVVVPFSVSDISEATVSTSQLTFTSSNWDTAQTITVTGVDDELFDGDISFQLISGNPVSTADANYDSLDASDVDDFTLTNEDNDGISASVEDNVTCYNGIDGSAVVSVSSGNNQNYTFSWTDVNNNIVATTANLTNVNAGSYTVTVTDADNVTSSSTLTITEPQQLTITGTTNLCVGSTVSLTGSGTASITNPWTSASPSVATVNATGVVTGVTAGTSVLTYTDIDGCSITETITVNSLPVLSNAVGTDPTSCGSNDGTITFNVTNVSDGNYTVTYTGSSTSAVVNSGVATISGLAAGVYSNLAITNGNGCLGTSNLSVVLDPTFTTNLSSSTTLCAGDALSVTSPGSSVSYQWYSSADGTNWNTISSATSSSYVPTVEQYYKVSATTTNCSIESVVTDVTIDALPTTTLSVSDATICSGSSATITVSSSETGYSYQLRDDSDDSSVGSPVTGTGSDITFSVSPTSTTTYNVLVTNGVCSEELSDQSTVSVDSIKPTVLTQNVTVSLDASGAGSVTVADIDNGSTDNCSIASSTLSKSTFDCSEVGANTIYLIVTDANGNIDSASAVVTVQDVIKPTVLTQNVTVSLDASGAGSVTVADIDNGSTDNCSIASSTLSKSTFDCSEVGANSIYLIVTDVNGNIDSASAVVTVQDTIKPTVVTTPSDIALGYCDATYTYAIPTGDDNCGVTVTQIAGLPPGSTFPVGLTVNTFEISDPSGNTVTTSFTVDIRARYMPFATPDTSICNNNYKIDLSKGFDNIIFIGSGVEANEKFFNPNSLEPGSYSITAEFTDSMGCVSTEQFVMEIRSTPIVPRIKRVASDQIVTVRTYNNYQWYRNGEELEGEDKQLLRVYELGIYSVLVGNDENCFEASEGYGFGIPVNDENVTSQGLVKVFPNPTRDMVFVRISSAEEFHKLTLTDVTGNQLIEQETSNRVVKLDLSTLANGTYYLNVIDSLINESVVIIKK